MVLSSVLHSATSEAVFERCSGDLQQVSNFQQVDFDEMDGRFHHGVIVNLDEANDLLLSFGLLSDSDKPGKGSGKVSPHQSALNKLMQYGQASRSTKSCGAFGEGQAPKVSVAMEGNLHPAMCPGCSASYVCRAALVTPVHG